MRSRQRHCDLENFCFIITFIQTGTVHRYSSRNVKLVFFETIGFFHVSIINHLKLKYVVYLARKDNQYNTNAFLETDSELKNRVIILQTRQL